jgi:hypothetical protein
VKHDYGIKEINLIPFICDTLDDIPLLSEHNDFRWIVPEQLKEIDFSEADVIVAEKYLATLEMHMPGENGNAIETEKEFDEEELKSIIQRMMSMKEADWMAVSAIENPVIFKKLLEYSYSEDKKLAFRASWTLSKVCDRHPEMILPYLDDLVDTLSKIDNESVERSFLRIVSFAELGRLSQKRHGMLADHCFASLNSALSAIAIKAYAMEILYKLTLIYPELGSELAASIRIIMEEGSAGMVARGQMILRKISEIPLVNRPD